MTNKIIKSKRAQTEPNQCDWLTNFPTQDINNYNQKFLNLLVDKAGMAESGQLRLVNAQFSLHGNGGSKLRVSESPSPGVQTNKIKT